MKYTFAIPLAIVAVSILGLTIETASAESIPFYNIPQLNDNGVFKDYKLSSNSTQIKLETANSGSLIFNKNTCSFSIYDNGIIQPGQIPKIKNISWDVKGKLATSSNWSSVNQVNNAACSTSVTPLEDSVIIRGTKTAAAGTFEIELRYISGFGIKETMRAFNNNPAWTNHHIGFMESFEVPQIIKFGNHTRDLANYNGTTFGRTWLENNEAKIMRLGDQISYDFDIGFANLNDVKVLWDGNKATLQLNYLYPNGIIPYGEWFEVDPTFNFNTSGSDELVHIRSGQAWSGQKITSVTPRGYLLNTATFYLARSGSPTGNAVVELRTVTPDALVATSTTTLNTATVALTPTPYTFSFNSSAIIPSQDFWVGVYYAGGSVANRIMMYGALNTGTAPDQNLRYNTGGVWADDANDDARGNMTYSPRPPNSVTSLTYTDLADVSLTLSWTAPSLNGGTLQGYGINYTTPYGSPLTVITNSTGSALTTYDVSGLTAATPYSFRVKAWTEGGSNITSAKILNVTTLAFVPANFTIGNLNFDADNPNRFPIRFDRDDLNSTAARLQVIFDTDYIMDCTFTYRNAQTSHTYTSLSETPYATGESYHNFTILNPDRDVTQVQCTDQNTNDTGVFVLNQSDFPLLQQIQNFRNGTYGTAGMFGALDFITVAIIIFSTVAFSRINGAMGVLINISLLMALQYFEIINIPGMIIGVIAVVIITVVGATRKD